MWESEAGQVESSEPSRVPGRRWMMSRGHYTLWKPSSRRHIPGDGCAREGEFPFPIASFLGDLVKCLSQFDPVIRSTPLSAPPSTTCRVLLSRVHPQTAPLIPPPSWRHCGEGVRRPRNDRLSLPAELDKPRRQSQPLSSWERIVCAQLPELAASSWVAIDSGDCVAGRTVPPMGFEQP